MEFHALEFMLFYGLIAFVYFLLPGRLRWILLLLASYFYFWTWTPDTFPALLAATFITYLAGLGLDRIEIKAGRIAILSGSLVITLGLLVYFKYLGFFIFTIQRMFSGVSVSLPEALAPIGISFYSLQLVSYTLDVYRGVQKTETHLGHFALYVSFFPQLVAGPIARAKAMLPQYKNLPGFLPANVIAGFQRILWGAFMKFAVADRLAPLVNRVFEEQRETTGWPLWVGMYLFSVQIYCDFAGYSNIAIGIAKIMGINLPENFNRPYLARDVVEFWNRWHISLSTWLRDYIFYPLMRWLRSLGIKGDSILNMLAPPMVTMLVSGLWHGAGWNFILWGGMHGLMLVVSTRTARARQQWEQGRFGWLKKGIEVFITFQAVSFAWTFFRTPSIPRALDYVRKMFYGAPTKPVFADWELIVTAVVILVFLVVEVLQTSGYNAQWLDRQKGAIQFVFYLFALFFLLFMGDFKGSQPFIYQQF